MKISTEKDIPETLRIKRIEWDKEGNVEHVWEQVKRVMVETVREVCGSVRKNPKCVWWNDVIKAAVKKKKAGCKEELGARDEVPKERCKEAYKEKRKVKMCIYQSKRDE